jgi:large subunit ribosomal protein L10
LAITKSKKEELVAEYVEMLNQSNAVFMTEYTGLSVKRMQELRAAVSKSDGTFVVTKNTLMVLALQEAGMPAPADQFIGQLATGFALDEVPGVAKALTDFLKGEEMISVKFGILGDKILSAEEVLALAKLPSLDELRAQILAMIQAPARNVAIVLAGSVQQVVNVLDAYANKDDEGEMAEIPA